MNITRTTTLKLIKITSITIVALIIIIYAISRSLDYTRGPKIDITEPKNGATIALSAASSTVDIVGILERAHNLTINGSPVVIDEQGHFKQTIVIFEGINRPTLTVTDQFNRTTETTLEIVGVK